MIKASGVRSAEAEAEAEAGENFGPYIEHSCVGIS